jgi:hypothetical protein
MLSPKPTRAIEAAALKPRPPPPLRRRALNRFTCLDHAKELLTRRAFASVVASVVQAISSDWSYDIAPLYCSALADTVIPRFGDAVRRLTVLHWLLTR